MKAEVKLTSVNILDDVYKKFKVKSIEGSINLQKLVADQQAEQRKLDDEENKDDFVILCGVSNAKVKEYFILPTFIVDRELKKSNELYHKGQKKDGSKRKI